MNRKEFFESIQNEVKEASIFQVFDAYSLHYERGSSRSYKYADCPFCGASIKERKSNLHEKHNGFLCYKCLDTPLNPISFIMEYKNLNYVNAILDMSIALDVASSYDVDNYRNTSKYRGCFSKVKQKIKPIERKKMTYVQTPIASHKVLNEVYRVFMLGNSILKGGTVLSNEHKSYLLSRGLTEEDIVQGGYFTLPNNGKNYIDALLQILKEKHNIDEKTVETVPGFYRNAYGNITYKYSDAIGIPIINFDDKCRAIQIRLNKEIVDRKNDGTAKKLRYIWLSSENIPKGCSGGVSSGAPVDVTYPKIDKSLWGNHIFITEGRFKAQQLSKYTNCVVLSVQGVGNWKEVVTEIEQIQSKNEINFKKIFVSYDADISYKTQVHNHATNMSNALKEKFDNKEIYYCLWNPNDGKGIDDLIFNKKTDTIKTIKKDAFDMFYNLLLKNIQKRGYNFNTLLEDDKEDVFINCILNRIKK